MTRKTDQEEMGNSVPRDLEPVIPCSISEVKNQAKAERMGKPCSQYIGTKMHVRTKKKNNAIGNLTPRRVVNGSGH